VKESKVLIIVTSLDRGGLELYLLEFLRWLKFGQQARGVESSAFTILCRNGRAGSLNAEFIGFGVEVVPLLLRPMSLADHAALFRLLRRGEFTAVVDFGGYMAGCAMLTARLAGVGIRLTAYRESVAQFRSSFLKNLYASVSKALAYFFATKILSNSKYALVQFHPWSHKRDKFLVVPNAVSRPSVRVEGVHKSLRRQFEISDRAFVFGHAGRFVPAKNHRMLLELANDACTRFEHVYFVLCGKEVTLANCRQVVPDIHRRVIFAGELTDMDGFYRAIDALVFPSINEGQPNVLLETMVRGIPFVASKIPPILEIVPEEARKQLVTLNDNKRFGSVVRELIGSDVSVDWGMVSEEVARHHDAASTFSRFLSEMVPK
jgi:glycosyltransferase involved in cell wall biosynthesis